MAAMAQKADGTQDSACGFGKKAQAGQTILIEISPSGKVNATKRSIKMVLPL